MKWLLLRFTNLLSLLVVTVMAAVVWIVGTSSGSGWVIQQINIFEPRLSIDHQAGSLWSGLQINSLLWEDQYDFIKLKNIHSEWSLSCLLKSTVCIKKLNVGSILVRIDRPEDQNKKPTGAISLPEIIFPVTIELDELTVSHLEIQSADQTFDIENIALQAAIEGDRLRINHFSADYQNYGAELSGTLQLSGDYALDIQSQVIATNLIENQNEQINLRVFNSVKEIEFEGVLSGVVAVNFNGNANPLEENLSYSARIEWQQLHWPLIGHPDFKADQGYLTISGKKLDYSVTLNTKVEGKNIPESTVQARLNGNAEQLTVTKMMVETLNGTINLNGELSWKEQLKWSSHVEFSNINPGQHWLDYPGELNGVAQISGAIDDRGLQISAKDMLVYGDLRGYPLKITANVERNSENHIKINQTSLVMGENRVIAEGSLTDKWNLSGHIDAPHLAALSPDIEGQLYGSFTLHGLAEKPDIKTTLSGKNFRYLSSSIGTLELQANIKSLFEKESQIELIAHDIKADSVVINQADIRLKGTRAEHLLQLAVESQDYQIDAKLSGGLSQQQDWDGAIAAAQIRSMGQHWKLTESAALSWRSKTGLFNLAPHCWHQKKAELCLLNQLTNSENEEARVMLTGYELSELQQWLPEELKLTGILNAYSHTVWGRDQGLTTTLNAEIHDGGIEFEDDESGEAIAFKYQKLVARAVARPEQFEINLTLLSRALGNAAMSLVIDPKQENRPITGLAQIDGLNIEFIRGFFPRIKTLTGIVNAAGKIGGTLKSPSYVGDVALSNLAIDSPDLPIGVKNGDIEFNLDGDKGVFQGAWQTGGGPVKLSGTADWNVAQWQVDLAISGQQLEVQYPPVLDAKISPNIAIQIRPQRIDINGEIGIPQGRIKLKELPESATALSNDVVIVNEEGEKKESDSAWAINTYLLLNLGDDVRLSGFGLRALLAGELRIIQAKSGEPDMYGEIFIVEGTYKGYGQDLEVEGGRIVFVGPLESTALEIDALRKTDDVTAGLQIRGTINQPDITLFSQPQQSEEDTLAYIILGRPTLRSKAEGSVLASAALSLGVKGGRGIATKIAKKLGIREFEVEASEQGGQSQVVFSGRLLPNLTMRYGVGVFTPESTWTLRYDLTQQIYIETIQGLESSLDIFYSFDFQSTRALFK